MGRFLRDEYVKNISVDESALSLLSDYFEGKEAEINATLTDEDHQNGKQVFLTYIIRFDNKGYRLHDFNEVSNIFNQAKEIERVIFTLESTESIRSNRLLGTHMELRLDAKDPKACSLTVSSDDGNWVDSSFANVSEQIKKNNNRSSIIRNGWTQFIVQIFGVTMGFIISLWAAIKISPHLSIENAFVVSFLFAFLVFSNTWTFLNQQIINLLNYYFPNLRFQRKGKDTLHWLTQTIIGGIVLACTLFALNKLLAYVGKMIGNFLI